MSLLLQRFPLARCYIWNCHLGESLSGSLCVGVGLAIHRDGVTGLTMLPFGLFAVWQDYHRWIYAQMVPLQPFHHVFSDLFWILVLCEGPAATQCGSFIFTMFFFTWGQQGLWQVAAAAWPSPFQQKTNIFCQIFFLTNFFSALFFIF